MALRLRLRAPQHRAEVVVERCRTPEADPQRLKAHTRYHWWPPEPLPGYPL